MRAWVCAGPTRPRPDERRRKSGSQSQVVSETPWSGGNDAANVMMHLVAGSGSGHRLHWCSRPYWWPEKEVDTVPPELAAGGARTDTGLVSTGNVLAFSAPLCREGSVSVVGAALPRGVVLPSSVVSASSAWVHVVGMAFPLQRRAALRASKVIDSDHLVHDAFQMLAELRGGGSEQACAFLPLMKSLRPLPVRASSNLS